MKLGINSRKAAMGEVQTTLHWDVEISKPATAVGAPDKDVMLRITTHGLPLETEEYQDVELGGFKFTGSVKVDKSGELPFEAYEGTDGKVNNYFMKWLNARWSADGKDTFGKQHTMAELKADIKITLRGPDDAPTRTFVLIGAIVRRDNRGGDLGQTADLQKPAMTIKYDDFHEGYGGTVTY